MQRIFTRINGKKYELIFEGMGAIFFPVDGKNKGIYIPGNFKVSEIAKMNCFMEGK